MVGVGELPDDSDGDKDQQGRGDIVAVIEPPKIDG